MLYFHIFCFQTIIEPGTTHTCTSGPTGGWRCPVCGAVSPTAGAAQRHMDAHQGVKAFRCTICRYKGNTLRGMRTHIKMHFEKRGTDLQVWQNVYTALHRCPYLVNSLIKSRLAFF